MSIVFICIISMGRKGYRDDCNAGKSYYFWRRGFTGDGTLLFRWGGYCVCAFTADALNLSRDMYLGLPMVPFEGIEHTFSPEEYKMFVPLGYKDNHLRAEKYKAAKKKGYHFVTFISPKAIYYGTPVGENCFILDDSIIQPFTVIGANTVCMGGSCVCHHTKIGNHCFLASGAVVCGVAEVGDYTFIGENAIVRNGVKIASDNYIEAGTVIVNDTGKKEKYIRS